MRENSICVELSNLRLSAVFFHEAFRMYANKLPQRLSLSPLHRHADYEIFFLLDGALLVRGEEECVRAEGPSAVILPPLFQHSTESHLTRGYCMYFRLERRAKDVGCLYENLERTFSRGITVLPLGEESRFYIEQLAKAVSGPDVEKKETHLVSLLFSELFQELLQSESVSEQRKYVDYVNIIELFVSEHYREKIRLTDLAETLHLCPKQAARIIRKKFGCSFSDLVWDHRLSLARTMLESTEDSIDAIAEAIGCEYSSYFYPLFRKSYGMTPRDYRESHRTK